MYFSFAYLKRLYHGIKNTIEAVIKQNDNFEKLWLHFSR